MHGKEKGHSIPEICQRIHQETRALLTVEQVTNKLRALTKRLESQKKAVTNTVQRFRYVAVVLYLLFILRGSDANELEALRATTNNIPVSVIQDLENSSDSEQESIDPKRPIQDLANPPKDNNTSVQVCIAHSRRTRTISLSLHKRMQHTYLT